MKRSTRRSSSWVPAALPIRRRASSTDSALRYGRVVVIAEKASPTAILLDPAGQAGKLYGAQTTPHMFVIDPKGILVYQGAIDDIRSTNPDDVAKARNYVSAALDEAMAGKPVSVPSTKSYGCSVKY